MFVNKFLLSLLALLACCAATHSYAEKLNSRPLIKAGRIVSKQHGIVDLGTHQVESGEWYQVSLKCRPDIAEADELKDWLLFEVKFFRYDRELTLEVMVPGLRLSQDVMFYKYVPFHHPKGQSGELKDSFDYLFAFKVPAAADSIRLKLHPWRCNKKIKLEEIILSKVPDISRDKSSRRQIREFIPFGETDSLLKLDKIVLDSKARNFRFAVSPSYILNVSGQVNASEGVKKNKALMKLQFYDKSGAPINLLAKGLVWSEYVGAYRYLPTEQSVNQFEYRIVPPRGTASIDFGVQKWHSNKDIMIKSLTVTASKPDTLKEHLAGASIPTDSKDWLMDDKLVLQWLKYWQPDETAAAGWLGNVDNNIVPAAHGVVVSGDFYEKLQNGFLQISGFPPFKLEGNYTWDEDPFQNSSWRQRFLSLYWVALFAAVEPPEQAFARVKKLLNLWWLQNSWPNCSNFMVWDDHAVAMRVEALSSLFHKNNHKDSWLTVKDKPSLASRISADTGFRNRMAAQLLIDSQLLEEYLKSNSYYAHNHSLIHAGALLYLVSSFPQMPKSDYRKKLASARIRNLLAELYYPDGVSVEQASGYHVYNLMIMALQYRQLLQFKNFSSFRNDFETTMRKGLQVAINLIRPDGSIVNNGDTSSYSNGEADIKQLLNFFYGDNIPVGALQNFFHKGTKPVGSIIYTDGGYAVFRGGPDGKKMLFIDFSRQQYSHGHYDLGSYCYSVGDNNWLIDSGGPYRYDGSVIRHYITSSKAHSLALPDSREQVSGEAFIDTFKEEDDYYLLQFRDNVYGQKYTPHIRRFIILKSLEAFSVSDIFPPGTGKVDNNIISGVGVTAAQSDNGFILCKGGERLFCRPLLKSGMSIAETLITPKISAAAKTLKLQISTPGRYSSYLVGTDCKSLEQLEAVQGKYMEQDIK
jgi:hypothetical protein